MSDNPSFVLVKKNEVRFEERPIPSLSDEHDVKIAIKKTGICGSDVHYLNHGSIGKFVVEEPMVLGHESSGEVVEIGSKVTTLKVGDKVCLEPGVPSRYSEAYKSGKYNLCPHMAFAATPPYDGTLSRYYVLPADFCVKLPDHVSLTEGAMIEPLSVGVHANKLAQTGPSDTVIIFGAGPVGLLATSVAKAFGALKIISVDLVEEKLKLALQMGATHTFVPSKGDTPQESARKINFLMGGNDNDDSFAPSVALECTGVEPSIKTAIYVLRSAGRYVQVGMGNDEVNFPIAEASIKELVIKGSFRYCHGDYALSVDLVANGKVDVMKLVTHNVKFEDAEEAFKLVRDGKAIKAIIDGPL
ncbi:GroES-like protein [Nadsonia fulvescens var. elongata DSM 6958]|uniref:GroES-like protein n=1 Tax=Nadsonia fulvescens var. elongata DSM 6958 TaxID=857566 RepID=A0A1E3PH44_9ASCO|nr:GroES-like protein [Nadsonia fulvescens var. elongata DSM 6958]